MERYRENQHDLLRKDGKYERDTVHSFLHLKAIVQRGRMAISASTVDCMEGLFSSVPER